MFTRFVLLVLSLAGGSAMAQASWQYCAAEGQRCEAPAGAQVRFGIDERHNTRRVDGPVSCTVASFGDPAPRLLKRCEVLLDSAGWTPCAGEGGLCNLPGPARVRYGSAGRWSERSAAQSLSCDNREFGDPAPGQPKACEYRLDGGGYFGPAPFGPPSAGGLPWRVCAPEGGQCALRGPAMLRYGGAGRYVYREVSGSLACTNESLGGDPAPGSPKQCETLRVAR